MYCLDALKWLVRNKVHGEEALRGYVAGVRGLSLCLHGHSAAVGQRRSGSRWNGCAGPPEATCRSSASTSNADGSCASPAAASCDLLQAARWRWGQNRKGRRVTDMKYARGAILLDGWIVALKTMTFDPVTLAHSHVISEAPSEHCGHRCTVSLDALWLCVHRTKTVPPKGDYLLQ